MDFTISEKMKTILGMIDEFVDKELIPIEPEFLTTPSTSLQPLFEEKRKLVRQMELWAPNHPKEYGGMELNLMEQYRDLRARTMVRCRQHERCSRRQQSQRENHLHSQP